MSLRQSEGGTELYPLSSADRSSFSLTVHCECYVSGEMMSLRQS